MTTSTPTPSFDTCLQQWVQLDNQMKIYQEKIKEWREKRNALEKYITHYASLNKLENVPISVADSKLKITSVNVIEPITLKYLERTLSELIRDETQSKRILDHIKQKRTVRSVSEIKRFTNNK
jgi:hypothetical protein